MELPILRAGNDAERSQNRPLSVQFGAKALGLIGTFYLALNRADNRRRTPLQRLDPRLTEKANGGIRIGQYLEFHPAEFYGGQPAR